MTKFDRDFKEWYIKRYLNNRVTKKVRAFYNYPIEMQFGVYQLFADSLGVDIRLSNNSYNIDFWIYVKRKIYTSNSRDNRLQAMKEAVKQFKEWYNNQ